MDRRRSKYFTKTGKRVSVQVNISIHCHTFGELKLGAHATIFVGRFLAADYNLGLLTKIVTCAVSLLSNSYRPIFIGQYQTGLIKIGR